MRILALDYGTKRIGAAVSDPTGTLARPLPFLPAQTEARLAHAIVALAKKEEANLILLGLPRHMNGDFGPEAARVQGLADALKKISKLQIKLVDERLSTVQASRQLQAAGRDTRAQRPLIDSASAAVLLQAYLDNARLSIPLMDEEND